MQERVLAQDGADERVAVNGIVQGLPHADIVEELLLSAYAYSGRFAVEITEVGFRIGRVLNGDAGRNLSFAGGDHGCGNSGIITENIGRLLDLRLVAPISIEPLQRDALASTVVREKRSASS
jgi:hypothetical protein